MALLPGTRLGPYDIVSPLGAGGMGEVYRATDTKLKREVAIKVLPESVAADHDRLARFRREAEVLASLNHPNIAGIYGMSSEVISGGTTAEITSELIPITALIMELVEGDDLSQRIARGAIPIDDAWPIAKQIAEALEAAHDQGIVHRDLKPANIKVRADGTVKVLDFGLAKAMDPSAGSSANLANSPTMTSPAMPFGHGSGHPERSRGVTGMGVILGTAAYMSPEQAKGRAVDRRADIWAFGLVLYEMLTGRRAFEGEDVSDLLVAVLSKDVDLGALPPATPPAIVTLIRRCLVRDPKNRLRDIGEARLVLGAGFDADAGVATPSPEAAPPSRVRLFAWSIGAAVVAALAMWVVMRPAPVTMPQVEFSVPVPADAAARRGAGAGVALSPDGQWLVFVGAHQGQRASRLYARRLGAIGVTELPGTEGGFAPFFSPDGRWLAFFTDTSLMRMPVAGGRPMPITAKGPYSRGAWMSDDTIILGTSQVAGAGALGRVPASGGTATTFTTLGQGETLHQLPHRLPGGTHVLFSVHHETGGRLAVSDLESGTHRLLGLDGSGAHHVPGRLIFSRDGIVFQAPFELDRLTVTGPESSILPDAQVDEFGLGISIAHLSVDESGTLAYLPAAASALGRVSWLDGSGVESPTGLEPARYQTVRVAPDGTRVVVGMMTPETRRRIRVIDIGRGLPLDLEAEGLNPIWGAGDTIIFSGNQIGDAAWRLGRVPADNSQPPSTVYDQVATRLEPQDWSLDGRLLLAFSPRARGAVNRDLYVLEPGGTPRALLDSDADEFNGRISPDGRWLAYQSTASGTTRVYVRPFDAPGGTQTVSGAGGHQPVWARDGRALYFLQDGAMMKATAQLSPFVLSAAGELFRMPSPAVAFDVAPDGRFLVLFGPASSADEIRVVMGWTPPTSSRP